MNHPFLWAAGIENTFIPQARENLRSMDQFALTQHYDLWREDLDRVASLGVSHLRWGPPWYRVEPQRGQFDWSWTDEVIPYMVQEKGIAPILDLMHYGTPFWLSDSFADPDYPAYVADYAAAFAERYRDLVHLYTPLNEPFVNAEFCGKLGLWPPYLTGEEGFARLIVQLVDGQQRTMARLRELVPGGTLVAVEALTWHYSADPNLQPTFDEWHDFRFISYDLVTGALTDRQPGYTYLLQHGVSENRIADLLTAAQPFDWFGANFYPWSGGEVIADPETGTRTRRDSLTGDHLESVLRLAYNKAQLPILVTETSARRHVDGRAQWMDETLAAVRRCRADGLPVIGYTWFPVFTMIDWAYRTDTQPIEDHLLHLGLWDSAFDAEGVLQRHPTPLVERYRELVNHSLEGEIS
ncbi:MAG: family 1 glycosylhydrolase [Caldilineaceae bacterium]|nr:family 1 glycosylhydrolase [Caldilineaceae bacterium]